MITIEARKRCVPPVAALRGARLTDAGIHDAACVVAYFNFVNRVALGLGVEFESRG